MKSELDKIIKLLGSIDQKLQLFTDDSEMEGNDENQEKSWSNTSTEIASLEKKLEQSRSRLLHAGKMSSLGSLTAGIAHELNNPLTWVKSNLQIIETKYMDRLQKFVGVVEKVISSEDLESLDEVRQILTGALNNYKIKYIVEDMRDMSVENQEGVEKMKKIVSGIKSFARNEDEDIGECSLVDAVESALTIGYNQVKYVAEIIKEYDDPSPSCMGSSSKLSQVFLNLIVNAAQSMQLEKNKDPEMRGKLWLRVKSNDEKVIVEIEDNGTGVSKRIRNKIYLPFFTTKKSDAGTGLGLHIAKQIISEHQGTINLVDKKGKGAKFVIGLPVIE
ncbi:MAG: ATP-binding protein [Deltaproteobacteria bacterium]|jgi:two-component system NtrC family sensor kinase|nr:ATP-binding protein [Deltaproteobacteria bacterium]